MKLRSSATSTGDLHLSCKIRKKAREKVMARRKGSRHMRLSSLTRTTGCLSGASMTRACSSIIESLSSLSSISQLLCQCFDLTPRTWSAGTIKTTTSISKKAPSYLSRGWGKTLLDQDRGHLLDLNRCLKKVMLRTLSRCKILQHLTNQLDQWTSSTSVWLLKCLTIRSHSPTTRMKRWEAMSRFLGAV